MVTYSAKSATPACVTVGAITESLGVYTLPITTTAAAHACSSLITITAVEAVNSITVEQTFTVYTPKLKLVDSTSIANQDLTRGAGPTTITDVSQHFEGGIRPDIRYSVTTVNKSITPNSEIACVSVTQPDDSFNFTITPTANTSVTNCVATVTVTAFDGDQTRILSFDVTVVPASVLAFSTNAPAEQPTIDLLLEEDETRVIDLSEWHTGGEGTITYSVLLWTTNPLSLSAGGINCVATSVSNSTLTLTPDGTLGIQFTRCVIEFRITITDGNGNEINRRFYVERNTEIFDPLVATGTLPDVSLDKSASDTITNIETFFTGGTGTVTYSAQSATPACVTVSAITESSGAHTLPITTTAGANACSSLITVTATDDADDSTAEQIFTVYTPKLRIKPGVTLLNQEVAKGGSTITIPDISKYFEGGVPADIEYSVTAENKSIVPATLTTVDCVAVTQPNANLNFTITQTGNTEVTECVSVITIIAIEGTLRRELSFEFAITPPAGIITVTSVGSFAGTLKPNPSRGDGIDSDLTTFFAGGVGALTFTASSSNTSCVKVIIEENILTTKIHRDSTIVEVCTSLIRITATDTTGATKTTPGYTIEVPIATPFVLNAVNRFGDTTLYRGASSTTFDLTQYIEGGDGDIIYSATSDDTTCVDFTLTGADFTLTATRYCR